MQRKECTIVRAVCAARLFFLVYTNHGCVALSLPLLSSLKFSSGCSENHFFQFSLFNFCFFQALLLVTTCMWRPPKGEDGIWRNLRARGSNSLHRHVLLVSGITCMVKELERCTVISKLG